MPLPNVHIPMIQQNYPVDASSLHVMPNDGSFYIPDSSIMYQVSPISPVSQVSQISQMPMTHDGYIQPVQYIPQQVQQVQQLPNDPIVYSHLLVPNSSPLVSSIHTPPSPTFQSFQSVEHSPTGYQDDNDDEDTDEPLHGRFNHSPTTPAMATCISETDPSFIPVYVLPQPLRNSEGRYVCVDCNKTYTQVKHLKRHLLKHTGQKPYKCDRCSLTFARSDSKTRHMLKCRGEEEGVERELNETRLKQLPAIASTSSNSNGSTSNTPSSSANTSTSSSTPLITSRSTKPKPNRSQSRHIFNDDTSNIKKVCARYTNNPAAYAATKAIFKCVPQKPVVCNSGKCITPSFPMKSSTGTNTTTAAAISSSNKNKNKISSSYYNDTNPLAFNIATDSPRYKRQKSMAVLDCNVAQK